VFGNVAAISRIKSTVSVVQESTLMGNQNFDQNFIALPFNVFITGDLAFLSTLLGKENMSMAWCQWCRLSKLERSGKDHERGELWLINNIIQLCERVEQNLLTVSPENKRGCTEKPLLDAVPIENYIVPALHILIGVENALVNAVLEFVEEQIERLPEELLITCNNINTAKINLEDA
jgi:hypothetical protein